jgi:UDP-glucose 4-epimerase
MRRSDAKNILVTGGAGFIGSHLVDRLILQKHKVRVLDNLSSGRLDNLEKSLENPNLTFAECNLKKPRDIEKSVAKADLVFHFAANPEVRIGETDPKVHFEENTVATFNLMEALRKKNICCPVVFASTSTVYGEAAELPTPEDYGPCFPISQYGASKLGAEALLSAYAYTFDFRSLSLRFANIVGRRAKIGIILDFIKKLQQDSSSLEVLGDGTQLKSYLHVDDCVEAVLCAVDAFLKGGQRSDAYNIGSPDQVAVTKIAQIVAREMGIPEPRLIFAGGVDGGRGWRGDVKKMHLSTDRLSRIGWLPRYNSEEAVRRAARELLGRQ